MNTVVCFRDEKAALTVRATRSTRVIFTWLLLCSGSVLPARSLPAEDQTVNARPITVADAIRMTRLGNPEYFDGHRAKGRVAQFSPDGKHFVVVLRKGNAEDNTNEYSMLLYETSKAFESPNADVLVKISSSSNRPAMEAVKWLDDNDTICFLGEDSGQGPQVYAVNVSTRKTRKLTDHPTPVVAYDISGDGRTILFAADPSCKGIFTTEEARRNGVRIDRQNLWDLLSDGCGHHWRWDPEEVFLKTNQEVAVPLPPGDRVIPYVNRLSLSPDGKFAVIGVFMRTVPIGWAEYRDPRLHELVLTYRRWRLPMISRDLLLDTSRMWVSPLLNAPEIAGFRDVSWLPGNRSIYVAGARLPLDTDDPVEREARAKQRFDIVIVEDLNTPPEIYVSRKGGGRKLLLDLNPQFADLQLGHVELIHWKTTDGRRVQGGLYLPPDYVPGKQYPLVIQTHGLKPDRFSMDGLADWVTGFAARPLAAKGFVVLQAAMFASNTSEEGPKEMDSFEGAIDCLDARGLIERDHVGIVGFSRSTYHVAYTLTHSKYSFGAAVLTDGMDAGYFVHLVFGDNDDVTVNGGELPFGPGLQPWLANAPDLNLDKIRTPLLLEAHGASAGVLNFWSWYIGLRELDRPVDFVYLPDAPHEIVKPWEQNVAQQGLIDWFSFWLKGERDPNVAKDEQYVRWNELRQQLATVGRKPIKAY
jgi:dipeptidyl aminopeptidase/acylaminoacyl peptidase